MSCSRYMSSVKIVDNVKFVSLDSQASTHRSKKWKIIKNNQRLQWINTGCEHGNSAAAIVISVRKGVLFDSTVFIYLRACSSLTKRTDNGENKCLVTENRPNEVVMFSANTVLSEVKKKKKWIHYFRSNFARLEYFCGRMAHLVI